MVEAKVPKTKTFAKAPALASLALLCDVPWMCHVSCCDVKKMHGMLCLNYVYIYTIYLHHLSTLNLSTLNLSTLNLSTLCVGLFRWRITGGGVPVLKYAARCNDLKQLPLIFKQKSTDQLASLHHGPWPVLSIVQKHPKDCAVGASPGKKSAKIALLVLSYTARPIPISR